MAELLPVHLPVAYKVQQGISRAQGSPVVKRAGSGAYVYPEPKRASGYIVRDQPLSPRHHSQPQATNARPPTSVKKQETKLPEVEPREFATAVGEGHSDRTSTKCARFACCSLCPKIGNMTPLLSTTNKHTGIRRIWLMVGPFWPVMTFVTCPLILGISFLLFWSFGKHVHIAAVIVQAVLVFATMVSRVRAVHECELVLILSTLF